MRRVVVTGLGSVCPIGEEKEQIFENLKKGYCAVQPITKFDTTDRTVKLACEVRSFDASEYLDKKSQRRLDLVTQYAIVAAAKAAHDAKLTKEEITGNERIATIVSSGIGGISSIEKSEQTGLRKGFDRVSPFFITMSIINMIASEIAISLGINGPCIAPVTACSSSANAIGDAFRMIKDGYLDMAFTGGSEASITELAIGGFTSMKALTTSTDPMRASIPFDKERSGFVMGEGATILVLESLEHALKRNATIYAEVKGYGITCDANHITQPNPDGIWAARAMEMAIEEGGIQKEEVDYINAHGTSTSLNDRCEVAAVRKLFQEHTDQLVMSSTKSMTGHLLGASGAMEALITILSLQNDIIFPTVNYREVDENCRMDICANTARPKELHYALSNNFGFGGHNVSLLFGKWREHEI